nr:unnamed protein product [Spirometra erinaceieuropaei]
MCGWQERRFRVLTGGPAIVSSSPRYGFVCGLTGDLKVSDPQDTVQPTAPAVLFRARRPHQDWFDDADAPISKLLSEENHLRKTYLNRPIDDNKAAFYRRRRLV